MSSKLSHLLRCGALVAFSAAVTMAQFTFVVKGSDGSWSLADSPDPIRGSPAWGIFTDTINENGWSRLELYSNESWPDNDQAFAAGYFEGAVCTQRIWESVVNLALNASLPDSTQAWLNANTAFVSTSIAQNARHDPYWHQVSLVLAQQAGVIAGYLATQTDPTKVLTAAALEALNLPGDLQDLLPPTSGSNPVVPSHCSALIRITSSQSELFSGHASWSGAETMTRTWKMYWLPFRRLASSEERVPQVGTSFSGYPGSIVSGDDFYQQSSKLVVIETTIGNNNQTLYDLYMKPNSVLEWTRNIVANRLAANGSSWADIFSRYNSGTYNNEWLIVDYSLFVPGSSQLQPGTLWVVDQVPGYISAVDATATLQKQGYFASYNTASDPFIFDISGWQSMVDKWGPYYSYASCPRALIFARDAPRVDSLEAMARIMRYNEFQTDPLSREGCRSHPPYNAQEAIAARSDLNPPSGDWAIPSFGLHDNLAVDAKVTSWGMMHGTPEAPPASAPSSLLLQLDAQTLRKEASGAAHTYAWGQSGPTHDSQPAFDWRNTSLAALGVPHVGMPDLWDFGWVQFDAPW